MPAARTAPADNIREEGRPREVLREIRHGYRITSLRREFQKREHGAPRKASADTKRNEERTEGVCHSVVGRTPDPFRSEASTEASSAEPCPGPSVLEASRRYRGSHRRGPR